MEKEPESRITLRLPRTLHDRLVVLAHKKRRSLNAQIVQLLEKIMGPK